MISSGFNRNVLSPFVRSTITALRNLPLPRAGKSLIASAGTKGFMLFSWSTCLTHSCYLISQPSTQLSHWHFISISILVVFSRSMEAFALLILQVFSVSSQVFSSVLSYHWEICWTWTTQRLPNLSVLPLSFCLFHRRAQCHDVYCFLLKTYWFRIGWNIFWMWLSTGCCFLLLFFVEHLLGFPGYMVF